MWRDERGSVSAEFAIVLPAVLVVLVLALGSIMLATQRVLLTSAAAEVARLEARGDAAAASARLGALGFAATAHRSTQGPLHCVTLQARPAAGVLASIEITSRACAAQIESVP